MAEFIEVLRQGNRMCDSYDECRKCPLYNMCEGDMFELYKKGEEIEAIVMKWAKEHPVKTNLDKLMEIFPMLDREKMHPSTCYGFSCPQNCDCDECEYKGFWNREYEKTKENNNG